MDHSASAYGVVDLMVRYFDRVILVTPRPQIAQNVNYCSAIGVYRRLHHAEVDIVTAHDLVDYREGTVTCRNVFTHKDQRFEGIDEVIYVTPRLVIDTLGLLLESQVDINRVGDCQSPRNLMTAIHNGHLIGLNI